MSEKTHIDDYLTSRLANRVHAFNPAHWEQAEALIAEQERQKRRRFLIWFWFGLGSLPILLMGMGIMMYPMEWKRMLNPPQQIAQHLLLIEDDCEEKAEIAPFVPPETKELIRKKETKIAENKKAGIKRSNKKNRGSKDAVGPPVAKSESVLSAMNRRQGLKSELGEDAPLIKDQPLVKRSFGNKFLAAVLGLEDRPADIPTYLNYGGVGVENLLNPNGGVKHRIRFLMGGQMSADFGQTGKVNFHPLFGGQYAYQLTPKLALSTAVQYTGRAGLNADSIFTRRDFGFGFEEERILRSPQRLHQLEIPLGIELRLKNRHYLTAGAFTSLMLDVSGKEALSVATEEGENLLGEEQVWGLRQGFRRMDAGAYVGYKAYLGKGLFLGANVVVGGRDLTGNSFYQNKRFDRHLGLRLSLSQDLWRR